MPVRASFPGSVFLLAGAGPSTRRRAVRFHADAVRATGLASPTIAFIGAASNDDLAFEKLITTLVFGRGARVVPVRLARRSLSTSTARSLLADADLLFFSGGDVDHGRRVLAERDLGGYVRELHEAGKTFEGISAGAMLLGRHWVRFPDDDDQKAEPFACLGVVPFSFDCHGEEDEWGELRALARLLPSVSPEEDTVFGIPTGGAARWSGNELAALGEPLIGVRCGAVPRRLAPLAPLAEG